MEKLRTFISIDPPEEIKKELQRIQNHILQQKFIGKLTEPENFHLTIKFLGEISPKKLSLVKSKLSHIIFPTFPITLSHLGTFSSKKSQPRIVWVKLRGKLLFDFQKELDNILAPLFKPETRFMAHLTIARIKHTPSPKTFKEFIQNLKVKPLSFTVSRFKLKLSKLNPSGPNYKTISSFKLEQI